MTLSPPDTMTVETATPEEIAERVLHRVLLDSNRTARRDEIAAALKAYGDRRASEMREVAAGLVENGVCPFPEIDIDVDEPCPVCGDLGTDSRAPSNCVANNRKGHARAIRRLPLSPEPKREAR